mmetsp:Transcript_1649/g.5258  ORF Transcript_1649/g.5258 Transcript_1649/m.5258 type:complete len:288 (+) Transcript_1649:1198-2061(+)
MRGDGEAQPVRDEHRQRRDAEPRESLERPPGEACDAGLRVNITPLLRFVDARGADGVQRVLQLARPRLHQPALQKQLAQVTTQPRDGGDGTAEHHADIVALRLGAAQRALQLLSFPVEFETLARFMLRPFLLVHIDLLQRVGALTQRVLFGAQRRRLVLKFGKARAEAVEVVFEARARGDGLVVPHDGTRQRLLQRRLRALRVRHRLAVRRRVRPCLLQQRPPLLTELVRLRLELVGEALVVAQQRRGEGDDARQRALARVDDARQVARGKLALGAVVRGRRWEAVP